MNSLTLLNTGLVFHITGIALLAGSTVTDFLSVNRFWKKYSSNKDASLAAGPQRFSPVTRIGGALLILSGIAMMTIMHGAYGQQIWMRIKIVLVVLIIINVLVMGRRTESKLNRLLSAGGAADSEMQKVKSQMTFFFVSQLIFFLVIFTLSVFKFN